MDKNQQIQELLIRLAASVKEEDLLEDPELEQQIAALVASMDTEQELPEEVVRELSKIKDKKKRFIEAMQILQVIPEPKSMKSLAEAMQRAGLLGQAAISLPGEDPQDTPLEQGHSEDPSTEEDDGFDPDSDDVGEDVDIDEDDVMASSTHRW